MTDFGVDFSPENWIFLFCDFYYNKLELILIWFQKCKLNNTNIAPEEERKGDTCISMKTKNPTDGP